MKLLHRLMTMAAAGSLLAACSQGAAGPPDIGKVNPGSPNYSRLQLAVGTANLPGMGAGLNIVSTLRQPNGDSAVLVDTPALTGPFTLPPASAAGSGVDQYSTLPGGPSASEAANGNNDITGTSQTVRPGTPTCDQATACGTVAPNTTTFGQSGGVFGMGFAPYNHTNSGVPASYVPYMEPLYDTTSGNAFTPWGGPPAFDPNHDNMGTRDGTFNLGAALLGVAEGLTSFAMVTPGVGAYQLNVVVPTGLNSSGQASFATLSASANLTSAALLPAVTAPALASDGAGGGRFSVTLPAGVTEGYIQVVDYGPSGTPGTKAANCQGAIGTKAFPVYYTIHVVAGTSGYVLPDNDGPNLANSGPGVNKPSPTLCNAAQNTAAGTGAAGDTYTVQMIGFDYPIYAASYPNSLGNQAPAIAGPNGQADITISPVTTGTY